MPRQLPKGHEVSFSFAGLPAQRQELVNGIFEVSQYWNWLELALALMFTWMLGGEEDKAFELYHNIVSQDVRFQLFTALAKAELPGELVEKCRAQYEKVRKLRKERVKVVHGVWGICNDFPNSLILLNDPKAWSALFHEHTKDLIAKGQTPINYRLLSEHCEEYKHKDFETIKGKIIKLTVDIITTSSDVLAHSVTEGIKKRQGNAMTGLQSLLIAQSLGPSEEKR